MLLSKYKYLYFSLILVPLFLSLDFSSGIRFDAHAFNLLQNVSIPFSLTFLFILVIVNFNKLFNINFLFLSFLMLIYLYINYLFGTFNRAFITFVLMIMPLSIYYVLSKYYSKVDYKTVYKSFYTISVSVILLKFFTDIVLFKTFSSIYFLTNKIAIYNYYDYYPFVYILVITLSFYNIENKIYKIPSILIIILSYFVIFNMESRMFAVLSLGIIFFILIFKILRIQLKLFLYIVFYLTITLTILISLFDLSPSDPSLNVRFKHWYEYIESFTFINIILPFQVAYRQEINYGTFHNEILEQFSYFGLLIYYYYYIIIKIFSNVKKEFEAYSFTILVILFIASLLQSNLTNPFLSIVWVNLILIFSLRKKENNNGI